MKDLKKLDSSIYSSLALFFLGEGKATGDFSGIERQEHERWHCPAQGGQ